MAHHVFQKLATGLESLRRHFFNLPGLGHGFIIANAYVCADTEDAFEEGGPDAEGGRCGFGVRAAPVMFREGTCVGLGRQGREVEGFIRLGWGGDDGAEADGAIGGTRAWWGEEVCGFGGSHGLCDTVRRYS